MRRGAGIAALGASLCVLAGAFGVAALYVPGVMLVLLAAVAETSVRAAAAQVQLEREPRSERLQEGAPVRLTLRIRRARLGLGAAELSPWPGAEFTQLGRAGREAVGFEVRLPRRGLHVIGPSTVRLRDPFGMCERSARSSTSSVLVLPRVEAVGAEQLAAVTAGARAGWRADVAAGADVDLLAPYRPGAPASLIHWPTVARTGTLVERRMEAETERLPLLVLDARAGSADAGALDAAVRAAASLCVALARDGGCSLLLPGERRAERVGPDLRSWPALHARLALVAAGSAPVLSAIAPSTMLIWVSAGPAPRARHQGRGADYLVTPLALTTGPVLFAVAGCAVQPRGRGLYARAA